MPRAQKRKREGLGYLRCDREGCDFEAPCRSGLIKHERTHTGEKPYTCDVEGCNFAAAQNSSVRRHMMTHTGERPYACAVAGCNFEAAQGCTLRRHMGIHTEGERLHVCAFASCCYAARSSGNEGHESGLPHVCDVEGCHFAARRVSTLEKHKSALHRPHVCTPDSCCYAARQFRARGVKPARGVLILFACDFDGCGFTATQRDGLTKHTRTHTGEKPCVCDVAGCSFATAQNSSLRRHRRRKHMIDCFPCVRCLEHTVVRNGEICKGCRSLGMPES